MFIKTYKKALNLECSLEWNLEFNRNSFAGAGYDCEEE